MDKNSSLVGDHVFIFPQGDEKFSFASIGNFSESVHPPPGVAKQRLIRRVLCEGAWVPVASGGMRGSVCHMLSLSLAYSFSFIQPWPSLHSLIKQTRIVVLSSLCFSCQHSTPIGAKKQYSHLFILSLNNDG